MLKFIKVYIDNQELPLYTLNWIPSRYKKIITTLDALGGDDSVSTLEIGKSRLLQEEKRRDMRFHNNQTESALFNSGPQPSHVRARCQVL